MLAIRRAALRTLQTKSVAIQRPSPSFITTKLVASCYSPLKWQVPRFQTRLFSEQGQQSQEDEQGDAAASKESQDGLDSLNGASDTTSVSRVADTPTQMRTVYVGNLFFELSTDRLREEFSQYGDVLSCRIAMDPSGLSKGFGYVEFATVDAAQEAVAKADQTILEGRRMAVQIHKPRAGSDRKANNPPSRTLFIGNLSFQMNDRDLSNLFKDVKNVVDVRIAVDRRTGQPRGFAHADFTDVSSAEAAKTDLENQIMYGRQLKIDFGVPSSRTRTFGRE